VIEWEQWSLTLITYPLLSAADLAAVLLYFDAGTGTFLRFRHTFLVLFSLVAGEFSDLQTMSERMCGA
jgi:hypothetical protein